MKCLSLWEPWATLFVTGKKRFETRHWVTKHRGDLLIHAAKRTPRRADFTPPILLALGLRDCDVEMLSRNPSAHREFVRSLIKNGFFHFGCILGKVNLVAIYQSSGECIYYPKVQGELTIRGGWEKVPEPEASFGNFGFGRYAWDGGDTRLKFRTSIPFKGHQTIFNVPDELVALQINAASVCREGEAEAAGEGAGMLLDPLQKVQA